MIADFACVLLRLEKDSQLILTGPILIEHRCSSLKDNLLNYEKY